MSNVANWEVFVQSDYIVIYPLNDTREHLVFSVQPCPCEPRVEYVDDGIVPIIIHNSFDGREAVEMANEILNKPT